MMSNFLATCLRYKSLLDVHCQYGYCCASGVDLVHLIIFSTQPQDFTELKYKINLLKTLWEKERILLTSIFPFSHNAFCPFILDHSQ